MPITRRTLNLPARLARDDSDVEAFIRAGFVGEDGGNLLAGNEAGRDLNVRRLEVFVPTVILEGAVLADQMPNQDNPNIYGPQIYGAQAEDNNGSFTLEAGAAIRIASGQDRAAGLNIRENSDRVRINIAGNISTNVIQSPGIIINGTDNVTVNISPRAVIQTNAIRSHGINIRGDNTTIDNQGDIRTAFTTSDLTIPNPNNGANPFESASHAILVTGQSATIRNRSTGVIVAGEVMGAVGSRTVQNGAPFSRAIFEEPNATNRDSGPLRIFNEGFIGAASRYAPAISLRREGAYLENIGEIVGRVTLRGSGTVRNYGRIAPFPGAESQLAINFGASTGSRNDANRSTTYPTESIRNANQELEIGPGATFGTGMFNGTAYSAIRFGGGDGDILRFVVPDADNPDDLGNLGNANAQFTNMVLYIIDGFNIRGVDNLPDGKQLFVNGIEVTADTNAENPLPAALAMSHQAVMDFIAAGFVGADTEGNLLAGDAQTAGNNLEVRKLVVADAREPEGPEESEEPDNNGESG